jgi:hypothetical protein
MTSPGLTCEHDGTPVMQIPHAGGRFWYCPNCNREYFEALPMEGGLVLVEDPSDDRHAGYNPG